jgi:hypothetical protein
MGVGSQSKLIMFYFFLSLILLSSVQGASAQKAAICSNNAVNLRELFYEAYREEKAIAYNKPIEVCLFSLYNLRCIGTNSSNFKYF